MSLMSGKLCRHVSDHRIPGIYNHNYYAGPTRGVPNEIAIRNMCAARIQDNLLPSVQDAYAAAGGH